MKKNLYYIYIGVLMVFLAGCQDEGLFTSADDELAGVSYRVTVEDDLLSRSIGDATQVNNLSVLVFKVNKNSYDFVLRKDDLIWSEVKEKEEGLSLPLFKGTYKVLFWLQYADDNLKPYTIANDGQVSVSYENWTESINDVEKWDAFYLVDELTISNAVQKKSIELTRPVGQLNWATQDAFNPAEHQVKVTLSNVATTFNPLTGTASGNAEIPFTFNNFTEEKLTTGENTYTYLTCNYLFPTTLTATFDLQKKDGTSVKKVEGLGDIKIAMNMRTNVLGSIVQEPEAPTGWDGETLTQPTPDEENRYIINEPSDLAWLASGENTLTEAATFLVTEDLDMGSNTIESVKLPGGSTFDGGGKTIMNFANSLFGNAKNLTVQNLTLDNVQATSSGHVGVLVNTLTGSSSFTGVTITNSSATTDNGAAGGMIGYITNKEGETLEVTFSGCTATDNKVNGSLTSGVYVGRFRGYNNSETLTFSSCNESSATIEGANPYYVVGNEATWLAGNDYTDYSGWLGNEEYYRGTINYGNNRYIPKWDGETAVDPIVENNVKLIYSPYDVAKLQQNSHSAVTFEANVDLGGHEFIPIKSITTLDGKEHTIYNLKVDMVHDGTGAAFIQSVSGTTTHKDITFVGADIKNVHNPAIPTPAYGVTNDGGAGNAYAGTLVSHSGGTYNVSNVHVRSGKVYAVCKMGGLVGYVGGNLNMSNCSVDDYIIENYAPGVPNYYTLPSPGYMDMYLQQFQDNTLTNMALAAIGIHKIPEYGRVNLLQWWYTQGEAGGLIGFVKSPQAVIDGCSVTNTNINCEGQPDKPVVANVWDKKDFDVNNPFVSGKAIFAKGTTDIAGRHVNQFIGDVVSARKNADGTDYDVTISNYTVSGNTYNGVAAGSTNSYSHDYASGKYCEVVGCAYYVGVDVGLGSITLKHVNDYAGKLTFYPVGGEATKVVLEEPGGSGNNQTWTGGSFSNMKYEQKNTGKWYSPNYVYNTFSEYPTYP